MKGLAPFKGDSEAIRAGVGLRSAIRPVRPSGEFCDRRELSSERRGESAFSRLEDFLKYASINKKPSWVQRDQCSIEHFKTFFGNSKISHITPSVIEKYKAKRNQGKKEPSPTYKCINLKSGVKIACDEIVTTRGNAKNEDFVTH